MKKMTLKAICGLTLTVVSVLAAAGIPVSLAASAGCPAIEITSGLHLPLAITQSNQDNLLVSETGTAAPNTGRISVVDLDGNRWTLLDGLPSGINDVNEPSGPAGLFMRGRTLYVAIGVGDVGRPGPFPGTTVPNPNPPSSPLFSSVLAVHFSADTENTTDGFALTPADHQTLACGERVTLSNGDGDRVTLEMIANFPDFTANPLPFFPPNVRLSNPFDLAVIDNQLFVTDGGQNKVWQVDIPSGSFWTLAAFPNIPNPLFGIVGGPFLEAVPTGIRYSDGQLLVTLFRGFPFPAGASQVQMIDPLSGAQAPFITGLKTAIDILPIREGEDTDWMVLQHASGLGPFFTPPGLVLRFETPSDPPTIVANCVSRPTSMTFDPKTGTLYVTELVTGRVVAIVGP